MGLGPGDAAEPGEDEADGEADEDGDEADERPTDGHHPHDDAAAEREYGGHTAGGGQRCRTE